MIPKFRLFIHYKGRSIGGMYEVTTIDFQERAMSAKNDRHNIYVEFDRCEIMQSTGLYDKNGTEIFEGDILELEEDVWGSSVRYNVKVSYHMGVFFKEDQETYIEPLYYVAPSRTKVVGNIYENPDLLKEKHIYD